MASEIDKLDPIPETLTLRSGLQVELESLKARQFFKLLRIITHGALPGMREAGLFDINGMEDLTTEEFLGRFLSITLLSIPDAEDETIAFIKSMVYPVGLIERKGLNKQDAERNTILWEGLDAVMDNPDLDDVVTVIEAIVKRESEDIQALGKRLASMFKLAEKTGQIPTASSSPSLSESTSASSVESPEPSISSRVSTAGKTKSSSRSRSVGSASVSRPSGKGSTTAVGSASIG